MEKTSVKKVEELDVDNLVKLLQIWDLGEFAEFIKEKRIDGNKILDVTEGIVKLWRPRIDAKKILLFIEDLKLNPIKYLERLETNTEVIKEVEPKAIPIECQYQTVTLRKVREEHMESTGLSYVEEILKNLVPAKSFLYRKQSTKSERSVPSYMPMDNSPKRGKRLISLSSIEYPQFNILSKRISKRESFDDRGYYCVKTSNRSFIQNTFKKQDSRTKYKFLSTPEEINEKLPEDHLYEDLCYADMSQNRDNTSTNQVAHVKPCMVKIQELFQSFKMPFFRKHELLENIKTVDEMKTETRAESNGYDNGYSYANMYDIINEPRLVNDVKTTEQSQSKLEVEEYLEPIQLNNDYCDIGVKEKDDSLLGYIMSVFENRFGMRRETNEGQYEDSDADKGCTSNEDARKWDRPKANMADRPLPIPVENEPYFMNVDRTEAENLLRGLPDGAFILRPSSQSNHAYTLSVSCSNAVHNVGVRRRPDGRLALGFPRRTERSFASVTSLLRHHRRRRLLLVAAGGDIGATTLNETPNYYQTPSNLPVIS